MPKDNSEIKVAAALAATFIGLTYRNGKKIRHGLDPLKYSAYCTTKTSIVVHWIISAFTSFISIAVITIYEVLFLYRLDRFTPSMAISVLPDRLNKYVLSYFVDQKNRPKAGFSLPNWRFSEYLKFAFLPFPPFWVHSLSNFRAELLVTPPFIPPFSLDRLTSGYFFRVNNQLLYAMKKNLDIDLRTYFGKQVSVHQLRSATQGLTIRHAERTYYQTPADEAILQEFDGRSGYLYSIELTLTKTMDIPIRTEQPDLHILYLMEGAGPIQLIDAHNHIICRLATERSCYLYLPAGDYIIRVSSGWSNIFGFYFDGGIFRDGNDKEFHFLEQVLTYYRSRSPQAIASVDFWVGPLTKVAIMHFCRNLKRGILSNEDFISRNIYRLIDISKKKVAMPNGNDYPMYYIHAVREHLVHELKEGNGIPSLEHIAADIQRSVRHINRLHKELFQITLREYTTTKIAELAVPMLQSGMSVTAVSNHFNYSDSSAFARIIKSKTGKIPSQWAEEKK
ncbi:hypothetical protein C4F40_19830 [Sphingobacterium sp. Ka21]|uniref:HTH araC/xylS-type domain-containing protein n=2 Tax=Sphingobacterium pedocola TaxID=2082722 RepID=A0ABR9TC89_9SPHI|nr:hypothetical protein [Sphingobacterium pedocola]